MKKKFNIALLLEKRKYNLEQWLIENKITTLKQFEESIFEASEPYLSQIKKFLEPKKQEENIQEIIKPWEPPAPEKEEVKENIEEVIEKPKQRKRNKQLDN